jgi:hypothetical protein
MMLGRASEVELAGQWLEAVEAGRCPVLVLEGPAGIGKTTVLEAVADEGRERGHEVRVSGGVEMQERVSNRCIAELVGVPPSGVSPLESHRAVRRRLVDLAADQAVLVLVDDVQWLDSASAAVLSFLVARPPAARVGILLAGDHSEWSPGLDWSLSSRPHAILRRRITGLDRASAATLLAGALDEEYVTSVHLGCGGNPFLLGQVVRSGLAAQDVVAHPPRLGRTYVDAELDRCSVPARLFASAGAVLGDPFPLDLAGEIAALKRRPAERAAKELVSAELIQPAAEPGTFRFRHPLVRTGAYERPIARWRQAAHGRAALLLAEKGAPLELRLEHVARSEPEPPDLDEGLVGDHGPGPSGARGFIDEAVAAWGAGDLAEAQDLAVDAEEAALADGIADELVLADAAGRLPRADAGYLDAVLAGADRVDSLAGAVSIEARAAHWSTRVQLYDRAGRPDDVHDAVGPDSGELLLGCEPGVRARTLAAMVRASCHLEHWAEAVERATALEDLVVPGGSPVVAMAAAESRTELALAGGDPDRACVEAAAAVAAADAAGLPIESARLGTLLGRAQLAAGQAEASAATLDAAAEALAGRGAVGLLALVTAARPPADPVPDGEPEGGADPDVEPAAEPEVGSYFGSAPTDVPAGTDPGTAADADPEAAPVGDADAHADVDPDPDADADADADAGPDLEPDLDDQLVEADLGLDGGTDHGPEGEPELVEDAAGDVDGDADGGTDEDADGDTDEDVGGGTGSAPGGEAEVGRDGDQGLEIQVEPGDGPDDGWGEEPGVEGEPGP